MIIGKLPYKTDLLRELNKFANEHDVAAGFVQLIGSLSRARLSYYDQQTHAYQVIDFDAPYEIVAGTGNISLRDGSPYVHIHVAVSDRDGKVIGGHCLDGCLVFAVEFIMWPYRGPAPRRTLDAATGLFLLEKNSYEESR
jgi:predicted DNA-binding protein with PD1-like motif